MGCTTNMIYIHMNYSLIIRSICYHTINSNRNVLEASINHNMNVVIHFDEEK